MKLFFSVFPFLIIAANALLAQDVNFSNRLLEQYQSHQNHLKSTHSGHNDKFWLTPLLLEAKQNWNKLTPEARQLFGELSERPIFQGTEKKVTYGNFVFHYSVDGPEGESVDPTDADQSNIPDYVERLAYIFGDSINSLYHQTTKLALPPNDEDHLNGAFYDIYISGEETGDNLYGFVSPETTIGDNPNSTGLVEANSSTSFMVMRNNYNGFPKDELTCISVTAAHEYMHAVQVGYSEHMNKWFMEAVATWSEDYAFPGYDDNFQYIENVFSATGVALNYEDAEDSLNGDNDGHWYSSWLFMKYLTEHTSNSIIKDIYESCITSNSIDAIDNVLKNKWNSTFDKIFIQYIIANSLLGTEDNFEPYTYQRATDYFNKIETDDLMKYEDVFEFTGDEIHFNSQTDGNSELMRLSYENFLLTSSSNYTIEFNPANSESVTDIVLIKYSSENGTELQLPTFSGNISKIEVTDNSKWDYYIPVIVRLDATVTDINPVNYNLTIKKMIITNTTNHPLIGNIFPNPADDRIVINIEGLDSGTVTAELRDLTGKSVLFENIRNRSSLDVSNIQAGIYILKVSNDKGLNLTTKQIIK